MEKENKKLELNKQIVANLNHVVGGADQTRHCPTPVSETKPTVKDGCGTASDNCAPTEIGDTFTPTTCESIIVCTVYMC